MFRIEITHDVDHLGFRDHIADGGLVRFAGLCCIGLARRSLSPREWLRAMFLMSRSALGGRDAWFCVPEWLEREKALGIRSTWFVACRRGRGIAYTPARARQVVDMLKKAGCAIGLHSQCRDDPAGLAVELAEFREVYGIEGPVPLRMHYLAGAGFDPVACSGLFLFDSSILASDRFFGDGDFERPVNIMDGEFVDAVKNRAPAARMMESARLETARIFAEAARQGLGVTVDLHQRSLSPTLPRYREYALWVLEETKRLTR
ncbi:MAG: hypothetical protein FJ224_02350 [Lentisphaerae bacterium]|nr:hypothetical protein [Lentisphaerota bacterium]